MSPCAAAIYSAYKKRRKSFAFSGKTTPAYGHPSIEWKC